VTSSNGGSVNGRDPFGRKATWHLQKINDYRNPESPLPMHVVQLGDETKLLRKTLPTGQIGHDARERAEQRLDNEIRALVRLATRYPDERYPAELPGLAGYDFDSAEPFVLIRPYLGPTVASESRVLLTDERRNFIISLFRALAHLAAVDFVHGAITVSNVCWDGHIAQVINFEHAVRSGEAQRTKIPLAGGRTGATPSEHAQTAHPGDDVLAAALAVHQLITGRPLRHDQVFPDLSDFPATLAGPLRDVFRPDRNDRPTAAEVVEGYGAGNGGVVPLDVDGPMNRGRERFDRYRSGRHPARPHRVTQPPPTVSAEPVDPVADADRQPVGARFRKPEKPASLPRVNKSAAILAVAGIILVVLLVAVVVVTR
jgi:hypothetical protein